MNDFHTDAKEGYKKEVIKSYELGRPEYCVEKVRRILHDVGIQNWKSDATRRVFPMHPVLELGCGTGKFTRTLVKILLEYAPPGHSLNLILSDPADMSSHVQKEFPDIRFIKTVASHLHELDTNSCSAIIAAQAFHWFSDLQSIQEIHRVLRPGSYFVALWNTRDTTVSVSAPNTLIPNPSYYMPQLEAFIDSYYDPSTPRQQTMEWHRSITAFPGFADSVFRTEPYPNQGQLSTISGICEWILSLSVIAKRSDGEKVAIKTQLLHLLHDSYVKYCQNNNNSPSQSSTTASGMDMSSNDFLDSVLLVPLRVEMFTSCKRAIGEV